METRKTHGSIINSNIRPQSAGILSKLSEKRNNIIDQRLRQRGFRIDLPHKIIEKHSKPSKKSK